MINLRRRLRNEKIVPLRIGRVGHLEELRRRIARWIADHGEQIGAREPVMSDAINRAADNWFVLLAIADEAARHWPQRARDAATTLLASSDQASRLELLLGDIRDIAASPKVEQISSGLLVERLHKIEGRPWAEYGKTGKPLTQHQLARLLRDVGVAPEQITLWQVDDATGQHVEVQHRGYKLERFADAFARYLPAKERENADSGDSKCQSVRYVGNTGTSNDSRVSGNGDYLTVAKFKKPNNDGLPDTLTVAKPENGENAESAAGGVAFLITREMRRRLRILGYMDEAIAQMTPQQAHDIISPSHAEIAGRNPVELCAKCGRSGGNRAASGADDGFVWLHPKCEKDWRAWRDAEGFSDA